MSVIRTGISQQNSSILNTYRIPAGVDNTPSQIGIVVGVITTPGTPNKDLYEKNGKEEGIGTIFYIPFNNKNKNKNIKDIDLSLCDSALPLFSFIQDYPLPGEQVILYNAPSSDSQIKNNIQTYYLPAINLWNNSQQNSSIESEWKSFIQNGDIRNLIFFEGDRILQGRKGNGIRFGTTTKQYANLNEWSSVGNDGDPITILVNGYISKNPDSYNVEEINKELSSIYMTSTQKIPLKPGASIINKLVNTVSPENYFKPQLILNSNRIIINSKEDEILLFSKSNIELNTNYITNINSGNRIHLNSPIVWLGSKKNGDQPIEPLVLGNKLKDILNDLFVIIETLGNDLSSVVTTPQGSPLTGVNVAGTRASSKLQELHKKLKNITSNSSYTV